MFDYLWGEIAIIVFGMWMALFFLAVGALIGYERADYKHRKDILRRLDSNCPYILDGDGVWSDDRGKGVER